jgi:NAD(P)-dependent dehydrogenase (short-subunit alcohol dehydrogenase family)
MHSIFISGAAQGIGAAIATLFAHHGYKVGIYDLNVDKAAKLAKSLGEHASSGFLDVTSYESWQSALSNFVDWAGELNILVNNAGILYSGPFEQTHVEDHHRTMSVNVNGVLNGCHAAFPYLKQSRFARVINLSSASAIYGQADLASYSASKFAVRGLTEGLDIEWQRYGIRVVDVMPLFVQTDMVIDMNASSIKNMGVHLSAEDVALDVYKQATRKNHLFSPTHQPVGLPAKLFFKLSQLSPQFINRLSNSILSKR